MNHILYHANCPDGLTAAAVAMLHFDHAPGQPTCSFIPCQYGKSVDEYLPGETSRDEVYIVDFSFPREQLLRLKRRVNMLIVLDHHKTAEAELEGLEWCTFDMEKSGAMLAWERWFQGQPAPQFVLYVQDRDLWKWELPGSKEFSAGLQTIPWSVEKFARLIQEGVEEEIIADGRIALRFKNQQVEIMAKQARMALFDLRGTPQIIFGGSYEPGEGAHVVPIANATCFFSEVGDLLCEYYPGSPFSAYYLDRADGKRQWGLRSRSGFDTSVIAKAFGGGGHPGASGFTTPL